MAACSNAESPAATASGASIAAGEAAFAASCAECHGTAAQGSEQGPPLVDAIYRPNHHADGAFLLAVRRGVPQHHWRFGLMKPIEGISDEGVANIVAYVRDLQRAVGID